MDSPLISVVMSVYNCEEFIYDSLQSIKLQTFEDFEFIIYDDGSTDNTYGVAEMFIDDHHNDERFVLKKSNDNIGCPLRRNEAIKLARGKYIAMQDGDDFSFPYRLEKEVGLLENNDDIFCVGSYATVINEDGEKIDEMTYPPSQHKDISKMLFGFVNPVIDPSCMFRRDIFNKLGCYKDKWKLVPDFYLWARAIVAGYKFENIPESLIRYRKHPKGVMELYHKEAIREHMDMCRNYIHRKKSR